MSERRSVVISVDAKLGWEFHDLRNVPEERVSHARSSWFDTVELFADHDVLATWAVVGHLFLDNCTGRHDSHPAGEEWFARDPGGEHVGDSDWFGRDLIDAIHETDVDHDIGSH